MSGMRQFPVLTTFFQGFEPTTDDKRRDDVMGDGVLALLPPTADIM
jgi:hypothetical protein